MQEILDQMNGYSLRLSLPFLPPPPVQRPTPKRACALFLHSTTDSLTHVSTLPVGTSTLRVSSGNKLQSPPPTVKTPEKKRRHNRKHGTRGTVSLACATIVAQFLTSDEVLVVASSSNVATLSLSMTDTVVQHLTSPPSSGDEYSGVCCSSGSVFLSCGLGALQYTPRLRVMDDFDCAGHSDAALCITASADGLYFATGGRDAAVVFWSQEDGPLKYLVGHTDWVRFVRFHACGRLRKLLLLSASDDGTVVVWDPLLGEKLATTEGFQSIRCFDVARDDSIIALTREASPILFYRLLTQNAQASEDASGSSYHARTHSAPGSLWRSASNERSPPVAESRSVVVRHTGLLDNPHKGTMTALSFTPDGSWLVSASEDETIAVSSTTDASIVWRSTSLVSKRRCISFMNTISSIAVVACPPSSSVVMVCACSSDGDVLFWVVDPRVGRASYERKIQLQIGGLLSVDVLRSSL